MALVNIATVLTDTRQALKKAEPPGGVALLSYKRNRSIAIIKQESGKLRLREEGYLQQEVDASPDQFIKKLKAMIKREFPRSRKVRLARFQDPEELERERQKI